MEKCAGREKKAELNRFANIYNDIAWTHKIHEKQADIYLFRGRLFQWLSIACIAIASSGIIGSLFTDASWIKIVSAIMSFAALFISVAREAKAYELAACDHAAYAKSYLTLKADLEGLNACNLEQEDWRVVDCCSCRYQTLNEHSPRTTKWAVKKAEKSKNSNELVLFQKRFGVTEED